MIRYFALSVTEATSHLGDTLAVPAMILALHVVWMLQIGASAAFMGSMIVIQAGRKAHSEKGTTEPSKALNKLEDQWNSQAYL